MMPLDENGQWFNAPLPPELAAVLIQPLREHDPTDVKVWNQLLKERATSDGGSGF